MLCVVGHIQQRRMVDMEHTPSYDFPWARTNRYRRGSLLELTCISTLSVIRVGTWRMWEDQYGMHMLPSGALLVLNLPQSRHSQSGSIAFCHHGLDCVKNASSAVPFPSLPIQHEMNVMPNTGIHTGPPGAVNLSLSVQIRPSPCSVGMDPRSQQRPAVDGWS
jgi:hypothetical protein